MNWLVIIDLTLKNKYKFYCAVCDVMSVWFYAMHVVTGTCPVVPHNCKLIALSVVGDCESQSVHKAEKSNASCGVM